MEKNKKKVQERFLIEENDSEMKIFFHPAEFTPRGEAIEKTIQALMLGGYCTGGETKRLGFGEVELFFNPMRHSEEDRRYAVMRVEEKIREPVLAELLREEMPDEGDSAETPEILTTKFSAI